MAKRWGKVDYRELEALRDNLQKLQKLDMEAFCSDMAKELAARLLRRVKKRTPVGQYEVITYTTKDGRTFSFNEGKQGGTLRNNWKIEKTVTKNGNVYEIEVINPTEYASYVEYGHRQQVGRFVPQIGKRLKTPWVEGQFMLKISEEEVQSLAPKLLEKRLNEKLKEVFDVK